MIFEQGKAFVGIEADLAKALGRELQRPVEFVEVSWEKQIPYLLDNKTDIIMSSMSITRARSALISFSKPYFVVGQLALVRREDYYRYDPFFPPELPGPVGVKKGTTGQFLVQREYSKSKMKTYSTGEKAANALMKKRIDLFIGDATLVWWLAGAYEERGLSAVPRLLSREELAWGIRRSDPELLKAVNAFVQKMADNGELKVIVGRWLPGGI
jgi:polar amino acid transport system substrate-binding protein